LRPQVIITKIYGRRATWQRDKKKKRAAVIQETEYTQTKAMPEVTIGGGQLLSKGEKGEAERKSELGGRYTGKRLPPKKRIRRWEGEPKSLASKEKRGEKKSNKQAGSKKNIQRRRCGRSKTKEKQLRDRKEIPQEERSGRRFLHIKRHQKKGTSGGEKGKT